MSTLKVPVSQRDHIRGPASAPITLVEYGDYECPHCGMAHPVVQAVQENFGPQLRFVFRHFPLNEIHPFAQSAAEAAEFAGDHRKFWEMHDGLYANQEMLQDAASAMRLLFALAETLGLSGDQLRDALEQGEYAPKVRDDFMGGIRSGVNGTPSFFINGRRHDGSYAFDEFVPAIEAELRAGAAAHP
ncbi:MAG TPA: DsbA family protein [Xanthobacteraceae bacterium]|jgi:protein-disulfide isomerase|nr:DsbA family protein [Xanthobacteraceae bacterium]